MPFLSQEEPDYIDISLLYRFVIAPENARGYKSSWSKRHLGLGYREAETKEDAMAMISPIEARIEKVET